jgi:hypothetical protein
MTDRVWQNGMCSCGFFMCEQSPFSRSRIKINLLLRSAVFRDETRDEDDRSNEAGVSSRMEVNYIS